MIVNSSMDNSSRRKLVVLHLSLASAIFFSLVAPQEAISIEQQPVVEQKTQEAITTSQESLKMQKSMPTKLSSNNSTRRIKSAISKSSNVRKNNTSQRKPPASLSASTQHQDPTMLAQQQVQLIRSYNNTPPLFLTPTRDFYVDVANQPIGTTIRTISAVDLEGDRLEYSLKPANVHDASPYFSINPVTGELKLADKQLIFQINKPESESNATKSSESDGSDEDDEDTDEVGDPVDGNLYFLNVAADDGKYSSIVELQIHVLNSSAPLSAVDDIGSTSRRMEKLVQRKSTEFYNKLYRLTPTNGSRNSSQVIYPNFVNPSVVMPQQESNLPTTLEAVSVTEISSKPFGDLSTSNNGYGLLNTSTGAKSSGLDQLVAPALITSSPPPAELTLQSISGPSTGGLLSNEPFMSQPMILALGIVSAALIIALVLLMFIVPLSVKRLRKRLKHVELQHEQISQKASNGSSTICSGSSSSIGSQHHLQHNPSLSQFILSSDSSSNPSSVCRQLSIDSTISQQISLPQNNTMQFQHPRSHFICPPITNPVYLRQQQPQVQGQLIQNQAFLMPNNNQHHFISYPQQSLHVNSNKNINIYHPIDDEFYSTIDTESTRLDFDANKQQTGDGLNFLTQYQPDESQRPIESPNSDSGSSTRSLVRFLSLPARHAAHAVNRQDAACLDDSQLQVDQNNNNLTEDPFIGLPVIPVAKTIARSSQIARENRQQQHDWEIDRHKLRFLDILDEGQFGMVCRYSLRRDFGGEQIVAVKTLKKSLSKDERSREELMAEIEIMKIVCQHPNVVKLMHCCTTDSQNPLIGADLKPILLIMEYEELGKLQSFLENSRINHNYATNLYNNSSDYLTSRDLVKFIYHVAKGMEYISALCIVHRDLASRNILVSSQRICKIGDFGMARHMQTSSGIYERHSRNAKVPVRWMAPEVLLENKFTVKSDVFSFGILMWEIVTLGSTPYRHLKTEQVIDRVARLGERPDRPDYCHEQLYNLMSRCWDNDPDKRPTFNQLSKLLSEMLLSADDYIELDQYPDHNYCNIPVSAAPNELL